MTMSEGVAGGLTVRDGRSVLAIRLPWYRSLPLSCLESVEVTVDGRPVAVEMPEAPDNAVWDLRDEVEVVVAGGPVPPGAALKVGVAIRIPYITVAPGVPLVQRAVVRTEANR